MRQRGDAAQPQSARAPTAAAAATAASARAASKRSSTRQSRMRGFWIATACFVACVVVYVCCGGVSTSTTPATRPRSAKAGLRVVERDIVALGLVTKQVADGATLPAFEELAKTAAPIGAAYLSLLEEVSAAEDLGDGGHALQQLDVSQNYLTSVADAVRLAADVSYTKLKRMLLREPNAELAMAPTSLVRTTYGWMLCDLFLYSAVLPEYYLLKDDTAAHAVALLRAVNLLSWSTLVHTAPAALPADEQQRAGNGVTMTSYDIFNWSGGAACRKGPLGAVSKSWMQFCESSFASAASVERRAAATLEELIVLYPDYAPLRLHYAIAYAFLGSHAAAPATAARAEASFPLSEHSMKALRVVRNDRDKLGIRYKHTDAVHAPVLALLESYLTPVDLSSQELNTNLVHALGELQSCDYVHAALLSPSRWHEGVLKKEYRAPLLSALQLSMLLAKAQVHLGADRTALAPFAECL